MWTSTLYLDPKKVLLTRLIGLFYPAIYFTSLAPLQVENLPRQQLPKSTWVRVRNRLAGVCGSDLHLVRADGDLRIAPAALPGRRAMFPGHEVVGEVIEIGDDVQHLQVGDRVVLQHGPNCISADVDFPCSACANGHFNLCEHGTLPGPHPIGGGWSEEMLLPEQQLFLVPDTLTDEQAVMLEPAAVALHSVLRRPPQPGEQVLIVGAGTIGLLTLQVVRALAPQARVSVLARHPFQVEQATRMGATHIIYPPDSYQGVQRATQARLFKGFFGNRTMLGGFDVIYDTIGRRNTLYHALRWIRAQGSLVLVGIDLHRMNGLDLTPLWYREINLLGSTSHGSEIWPPGTSLRRSTFDIVNDLIQQAQIKPEQLITHHFALSNYREALSTALGKNRTHAIKVVFDYSLQPATAVPNLRANRRTSALNGTNGLNSSPGIATTGAQPANPATEESEPEHEIPVTAHTVQANQPTWQYKPQDEEEVEDDQATETMLPIMREHKRTPVASTSEQVEGQLSPSTETSGELSPTAQAIIASKQSSRIEADTEAETPPTLKFKRPSTNPYTHQSSPTIPDTERPPTEPDASAAIVTGSIPDTEPSTDIEAEQKTLSTLALPVETIHDKPDTIKVRGDEASFLPPYPQTSEENAPVLEKAALENELYPDTEQVTAPVLSVPGETVPHDAETVPVLITQELREAGIIMSPASEETREIPVQEQPSQEIVTSDQSEIPAIVEETPTLSQEEPVRDQEGKLFPVVPEAHTETKIDEENTESEQQTVGSEEATQAAVEPSKEVSTPDQVTTVNDVSSTEITTIPDEIITPEQVKSADEETMTVPEKIETEEQIEQGPPSEPEHIEPPTSEKSTILVNETPFEDIEKPDLIRKREEIVVPANSAASEAEPANLGGEQGSTPEDGVPTEVVQPPARNRRKKSGRSTKLPGKETK